MGFEEDCEGGCEEGCEGGFEEDCEVGFEAGCEGGCEVGFAAGCEEAGTPCEVRPASLEAGLGTACVTCAPTCFTTQDARLPVAFDDSATLYTPGDT